MKGRIWFVSVAVLLAAVFLSGFSAEANDIKSRMLQRLPVDAENRDRGTVYRMIAERQKTTPELVGKQRAAQIAQREPAGHWLQDAGGRWYRK